MDRSVVPERITEGIQGAGKISVPGASRRGGWLPSVEENESNWNAAYDWTLRGDEWSSHWGGAETHWHATLLPRVWPFLPTGIICEIAPGYGRWTQYLLGECDQYVGVDLASRCVDACRDRFSSFDHARFEVNDGRSLPVLENDSVDFVFSFDSLVHVEADVIAQYLVELARVLRRDGIRLCYITRISESSATKSAGWSEPRPWLTDLRLCDLGCAGMVRSSGATGELNQ